MNNNRLIRILLILGLAVGILIAIVYRDSFEVAALESWINDAGVLAPIVFILIYALATVLFLPGSVITLAGGALFGPVLGTLYNLTQLTGRELTPIPLLTVVQRVNQSLIGWSGYFDYHNSTKVMGSVRWHAKERVRTYLRKRHKVRIRSYGYIRFPHKVLYDRHGLFKLPASAPW